MVPKEATGIVSLDKVSNQNIQETTNKITT